MNRRINKWMPILLETFFGLYVGYCHARKSVSLLYNHPLFQSGTGIFQLDEPSQSLDLVLADICIVPQNQPNFPWRKSGYISVSQPWHYRCFVLDITLCFGIGGCPVNCRMFSRIPGLYSSAVNSISPLPTHSYDEGGCLHPLPMCQGGLGWN